MTEIIPINREKHQQAGLAPRQGFPVAQKDAVVPVVLDELPHLVPTMALGFIHNDDSGVYQLVAVQALQPGRNLYVHPDGRWIGGYVPAYYRGYPFRLMQVEGNNRRVLCVDADSDRFHVQAEPEDEPLFTPQGEPSQTLSGFSNFHQTLEASRLKTQQAVNALAENGLITEWPVKVQSDANTDPVAVQGLYHVDEQALRTLDPQVLGQLARSGVLSVAYTQLISEHRLKGLRKLYQLHDEIEQRTRKPEVDLDALFGEDDGDDVLRF